MTFNKVMETAIKNHMKERSDDLFKDIKGLKVLNIKFIKTVETGFTGADGENSMMTKYKVTCSMKAKKYENNRIRFEVNFYDNTDEDTGSISVYFDGTFYQA